MWTQWFPILAEMAPAEAAAPTADQFCGIPGSSAWSLFSQSAGQALALSTYLNASSLFDQATPGSIFQNQDQR